MKRDYTDFHDIQQKDDAYRKDVRADFERELVADLAQLGVGPAHQQAIVRELYENMIEPIRHYHTPVHVLGMFGFAGAVGLSLQPADRLAVWFHDGVYNPHECGGGANEKASAAMLRNLLGRQGVRQSVLDQAAMNIEWTASHGLVDAPRTCHAVLDLDLAGMSADPTSFARQSEAVRAEFSHLSDAQYAAGTIELFRQLLLKPRIYYTQAFAPREAIARQQLSREIDRLSQWL